MKKHIQLIAIWLLLAQTSSAQDFHWKTDLRPGDLLFQDLDCGPLCEGCNPGGLSRDEKLEIIRMSSEL